MAAVQGRIVANLKSGEPLNDDEIAARLRVGREHVNAVCRRMETKGLISRTLGPAGKIVNEIASEPLGVQPTDWRGVPSRAGELLGEDEVKTALRDYLEARGYSVTVMWGRTRGIDIEARGVEGRLIIEAKGEVASPQQQGNYFLGALGELFQRMSDSSAQYGLALPDNPRYRGLVKRLPEFGRSQLAVRVFFVAREGAGYVVNEHVP